MKKQKNVSEVRIKRTKKAELYGSALFLLKFPWKIDFRILLYKGGKELFQHVGSGKSDGRGVDAGMAGEKRFFQKLFVERKAHAFFPVIHKTEKAGRTAFHTEKTLKVLLCGEAEAGAAQLGGKKLGFEGLGTGHYQQVKFRLLSVREKEIFCDSAAQNPVSLV